MRISPIFRGAAAVLVGVLAAGMSVQAHAVDFGDMMNPGRWLGGSQDPGQERYDAGSGYGVPGYYGQYGQQRYYGSDPYTQPLMGQQPYGYPPYGQPQFGQPGMPPEGVDPSWSADYGSRLPGPDASGWGYGDAAPSLGVPGSRYERPRESDHRLEQRIRDLERRVDELERRQHDGRRPSPQDFPQPEYPPLR